MLSGDRSRAEGATWAVKRLGPAILVLALAATATAVAAVAAGAPGAPRAPRPTEAAGGEAAVLVGAARPSHNGLYRAEVTRTMGARESSAEQSWIVLVRRADGAPVLDADIRVGAWMPDSGERAASQPWASGHLGGGRYRIGGLRFSREGWWNVPLQISSRQGTDSLAFNLILPRQSGGAAPARAVGGAS